VSGDTLDSHRTWIRRLRLPYPLLSDLDLSAGNALGLIRRIGIGEWRLELFRRTTLLVDAAGRMAMIWGQVKIRGHAADVLRAARTVGVGS
jgi:peroxiredoxin Q/BCP